MQFCNNALVENNMRLVYYEFKKLHKTQLTLRYKEDLISEGMLGLVKAAKTFDESKGNKFSTYATMCIRNQMLLFIRKVNKFESNELSLNEAISQDNQGNLLILADILIDHNKSFETHFLMREYEIFLSKQKPIDIKILSAKKRGYNNREIAEQIKISKSYVSRRLLNLYKKWTLISA